MLQEQEELAYEFGQSYKPIQARMRMPKLESKKGKESTQLLGPFQLWAKNWMSKGMYTLHGFVPCKFFGASELENCHWTNGPFPFEKNRFLLNETHRQIKWMPNQKKCGRNRAQNCRKDHCNNGEDTGHHAVKWEWSTPGNRWYRALAAKLVLGVDPPDTTGTRILWVSLC